ncbi:MAG: hypothetical protein IIA45_06180 [Bacteroidetes bacterium]|nr:hypothetical protein [Bacteroidota bacterium]
MRNKHLIKVGLLVSYDHHLLKQSLPRIYEHADTICLSLDKNHKTWAGNEFEFDKDDFLNWVNDLDSNKKIRIHEDDFALPELNARENGNRQRTLLAEFMEKDGWHLQIDADEYFIDFKGFTDYLKKLNIDPKQTDKPVNVCCNWVQIIKKVEGGYIYADPLHGTNYVVPIASNHPDYQRARVNGHFNHLTDFFIIHETRSRDEDQLMMKLKNWGHSAEEYAEKDRLRNHFDLWKSIDRDNFKDLSEADTTNLDLTSKLEYCEAGAIDELMEHFRADNLLHISSFKLMLKNSRNLARLRYLFSKFL